MSIDERLRTGLAANTDHLDPDLEGELSRVLRRSARRRRGRQAAVAVVVAAVLAVVAWLGDLSGVIRGSRVHDPVKRPRVILVEPRKMEGVNGALEPGPWAVPFFAAQPHRLPRAVVDVPPGYGSPGGWVVDRGADGDPEAYGEVAFWVVRDVAKDPCHGAEFVRPAAGVRPLVDALVAQPGQRSSRPRPVTVDGHRGVYVELTQDGADVRGCHESTSTLWHSTGDFGFGFGVTGTVIRCWVLDVDGLRVVMTASTTPHETPTEAAEVVAIARSVRFIGPLDPSP